MRFVVAVDTIRKTAALRGMGTRSQQMTTIFQGPSVFPSWSLLDAPSLAQKTVRVVKEGRESRATANPLKAGASL
jgi:hypothetical protein